MPIEIVEITEILYYYDGPLLTSGYSLKSRERLFMMVAIPDPDDEVSLSMMGCAVELTPDDFRRTLQGKVTMDVVWKELRVGPYYYGIMTGDKTAVMLAPHEGDVPDDHIPGDVPLFLDLGLKTKET